MEVATESGHGKWACKVPNETLEVGLKQPSKVSRGEERDANAESEKQSLKAKIRH